ncbi:4Fe-4S binding protein [bacterium]|nr:4Fe-4S binding protein [bacterium]
MPASKIRIDHERCDFCGTCVAVCPADAIELRESSITVDPGKCTLCESCVDICPLGVPEVAA